MSTRYSIEKQQTLNYVKARLARLGERKIDLELNYQGAQGHLSYQIKVVDFKIDRLLDLLRELESEDLPSTSLSTPRVLTTF